MPDRPLLMRQQATLRKKESQLRAKANNAIEEVKKALGLTATELISELILSYPPEMPDQKYERRYAPEGLMGHWQFDGPNENPDGSISLTITNDVTDPLGRRYAYLVMDEGQQAEIHEGRWPTVQEIQSEFSEIQRQRVRAAIRKGLGI